MWAQRVKQSWAWLIYGWERDLQRIPDLYTRIGNQILEKDSNVLLRKQIVLLCPGRHQELSSIWRRLYFNMLLLKPKKNQSLVSGLWKISPNWNVWEMLPTEGSWCNGVQWSSIFLACQESIPEKRGGVLR